MTVQTLNNVGITNNWDLGSSGWKTAMDSNLLLADGLIQPNVASRTTTAPPGSPTAGDRNIVPHTGASGAWTGQADKYTAWDGAAWMFATPLPGWSIYVVDEHKWVTWTGSAWVVRGMREGGLSARTAAISSGTLVLDASLGGGFDVILNANVTTLTLSNPVASPDVTRLLVRFSQDATGGRTIALPGNVKCIGGTAYVPTPAALAVDLVRLTSFDAGTTWYLESSQAGSGGGGGGGGTPAYNGATLCMLHGPFSIPNTALTPITFDDFEQDSGGYTTGTYNVFNITTAGFYLLTASLVLDVAAAGRALLCFSQNGGGRRGGSSILLSPTKQSVLSVSQVVQCLALDDIELSVYQDSGASLDALVSFNSSRFSITFLGT